MTTVASLRTTLQTAWRLMPGGPRRALAHGAIAMLRPRLGPALPQLKADQRVPRIIVGMLSDSSGLGQSARLAAAAFRAQGYSVYGIDLGGFLYEASRLIEHGLPDGRAASGEGHVIVVVNAPLMPYALMLLGRAFLQGKHVTGYWAWEQPRLPRSWQRGFAAVHDIAVPSTFVRDAVLTARPDARVCVAPHPVVLDHPPLRRQSGSAPFTVLTTLNVGSGLARKNPEALIAAFKLAFGASPNARLKLLVSGVEQYPQSREVLTSAVGGAANIDITWTPLPRPAFLQWWQQGHIYALLHRAEGFGLPLAEAMLGGFPVIATGWSGNMDFMSKENSFPVRYRLVGVSDPQSKYGDSEGNWAEPDIEHAAALMRQLAGDPELAQRVGEQGRQAVSGMLTAPAFVTPISS